MQLKLTKLNLLRSLFLWSFVALSVQNADLSELLKVARNIDPMQSFCESLVMKVTLPPLSPGQVYQKQILDLQIRKNEYLQLCGNNKYEILAEHFPAQFLEILDQSVKLYNDEKCDMFQFHLVEKFIHFQDFNLIQQATQVFRSIFDSLLNPQKPHLVNLDYYFRSLIKYVDYINKFIEIDFNNQIRNNRNYQPLKLQTYLQFPQHFYMYQLIVQTQSEALKQKLYLNMAAYLIFFLKIDPNRFLRTTPNPQQPQQPNLYLEFFDVVKYLIDELKLILPENYTQEYALAFKQYLISQIQDSIQEQQSQPNINQIDILLRSENFMKLFILSEFLQLPKFKNEDTQYINMNLVFYINPEFNQNLLTVAFQADGINCRQLYAQVYPGVFEKFFRVVLDQKTHFQLWFEKSQNYFVNPQMQQQNLFYSVIENVIIKTSQQEVKNNQNVLGISTIGFQLRTNQEEIVNKQKDDIEESINWFEDVQNVQMWSAQRFIDSFESPQLNEVIRTRIEPNTGEHEIIPGGSQSGFVHLDSLNGLGGTAYFPNTVINPSGIQIQHPLNVTQYINIQDLQGNHANNPNKFTGNTETIKPTEPEIQLGQNTQPVINQQNVVTHQNQINLNPQKGYIPQDLKSFEQKIFDDNLFKLDQAHFKKEIPQSNETYKPQYIQRKSEYEDLSYKEWILPNKRHFEEGKEDIERSSYNQTLHEVEIERQPEYSSFKISHQPEMQKKTNPFISKIVSGTGKEKTKLNLVGANQSQLNSSQDEDNLNKAFISTEPKNFSNSIHSTKVPMGKK